jgi:hypothetical protein
MKADMLDPVLLKTDDDWLADHLEELTRKYPGKIIAVNAGKLVAVGDSYQEVYAAAKTLGIQTPPLVMEIPRPEEAQYLWPSIL